MKIELKKINKIFVRPVNFEITKYDCIPCMLRPIMTVGVILGISPIKCFCPHSQNFYSTAAKTEKSKKYMLINLCYCIFLLPAVIIDLATFGKNEELNSKTKAAEEIGKIILEIITMIGVIYGIIKCETRTNMTNGLCYIIEYKIKCGLKTVFGKNTYKKIKNNEYIWISIALIATIVNLTALTYVMIIDNKIGIYQIYRILVASYCFASLMFYMFQFILEIKMQEAVFTAIYRDVINNITENLICVQTCDIKPKYLLLENLKRLQQMHIAVVYVVNGVNNVLDPFLLFEFTFTIFLLILGYYVLATFWMMGNYREIDIFIMGFRNYSHILSILYLLKVAEDQLKPGIKLVNYLHNFPVIKLQTQEALQVEMIACTVNSIEPRYSASGVFTLGTGMITSITGTIISYVLIALQFEASNTLSKS